MSKHRGSEDKVRVTSRWWVVVFCAFLGALVALGLVRCMWNMDEQSGRVVQYETWGEESDVELAELPSVAELEEWANELLSVESIPVVNLQTAGVVTENDVYVGMTMTVTDDVVDANNQAEVTGQIKPRGNSTYEVGLEYGVMPFKIKLDVAVDLLGMGRRRKWCLLANFIDRAYVKQFVAFQVAQLVMGEGYYQPQAKFVEVYHNGEYKGLYLLTESVDEDDESLDLEVNIDDYDDDEVPFLLEMDTMARICKEHHRSSLEKKFSTNMFFADSYEKVPSWLLDDDTSNDVCPYTPYVLKYPDGFSMISDEQEDYVRQTMYELYERAEKGLAFGELGIDVDSFVNYWVFVEWFRHGPYDEMSTFVYKKPGSGVVTYGPLWDFDMDLLRNSTGGFMDLELNTISKYLFKYRAFRELVKERYVGYREVLFPLIEEKIVALRSNETVKQAALKSEAKYQTWTRRLNSYNSSSGDIDNRSDKILTLRTYEEHVDYILDVLFDGYVDGRGRTQVGRTSWLSDNLDEWGVTY